MGPSIRTRCIGTVRTRIQCKLINQSIDQSVSQAWTPRDGEDSLDTSQAEHFVTAKGLVEISGSPAIVPTTGLLQLYHW
jgi:hypothetical protein